LIPGELDAWVFFGGVENEPRGVIVTCLNMIEKVAISGDLEIRLTCGGGKVPSEKEGELPERPLGRRGQKEERRRKRNRR